MTNCHYCLVREVNEPCPVHGFTDAGLDTMRGAHARLRTEIDAVAAPAKRALTAIMDAERTRTMEVIEALALVRCRSLLPRGLKWLVGFPRLLSLYFKGRGMT